MIMERYDGVGGALKRETKVSGIATQDKCGQTSVSNLFSFKSNKN